MLGMAPGGVETFEGLFWNSIVWLYLSLRD